MSKELTEQTRNAFDFIQKLYFEISYLIKEVEGFLKLEDIVICRSSGYAVTTKTSSGLEPLNVEQWLLKIFSVFFCHKEMTKETKGQTFTHINDALKILVMDIDLTGKNDVSPQINIAVIKHIKSKKNDREKFEKLIWEFAYNHDKIFYSDSNIYESSYCSFEKNIKKVPLYSINSSEEIKDKLIKVFLDLYNK